MLVLGESDPRRALGVSVRCVAVRLAQRTLLSPASPVSFPFTLSYRGSVGDLADCALQFNTALHRLELAAAQKERATVQQREERTRPALNIGR